MGKIVRTHDLGYYFCKQRLRSIQENIMQGTGAPTAFKQSLYKFSTKSFHLVSISVRDDNVHVVAL